MLKVILPKRSCVVGKPTNSADYSNLPQGKLKLSCEVIMIQIGNIKIDTSKMSDDEIIALFIRLLSVH